MSRRRLAPVSAVVAAITIAGAAASPAAADPGPGPLEADPVVDGAITGGAVAGALLLHWVHVNDSPDAWNDELFGALDQRVKRNYSPLAHTLSDAALVASVAIPAGLAVGGTWDHAAGDRAIVMTESIAGTLLLTSLTKTLVGRPRPYTYSDDPAAVRHARKAGRDARRSFFSGHAATAFAALAAGGALYAGRQPDRGARAFAWGAGAVVAAAAANLRVRAGEHFYSDVLVGAVVGSAVGTLVPALHTHGVYRPSGTEWAALAGGLVLGATISQAIPLGHHESTEPLAGSKPSRVHSELSPLVLPGGGGLGVVGSF